MKDNITAKEYSETRTRNEFYIIDDLSFTDDEKAFVLEYLARQLDHIIYKVTGEGLSSKLYDPLMIDGNVAYSYAFNFSDGGRRHQIKNLLEIEHYLIKETIDILKES